MNEDCLDFKKVNLAAGLEVTEYQLSGLYNSLDLHCPIEIHWKPTMPCWFPSSHILKRVKRNR